MKAKINIFGPYSTITGEYPSDVIAYETSYFEEGAKFSKAFQKGLWDGRKHLFNKRSGSFPTGLLSTVKRVCVDAGYEIEIIDHREKPKVHPGGFELHGCSMEGKYDYQLKACEAAIQHKQGIIKVATGGGKGSLAVAITKYLGLKTLFIVPTRELLFQMQKRYMDLLDTNDKELIGIIGDGEWAPGSWVTIALIDTLESRLDTPEMLEFMSDVDVMFMDEAHRCGSETYFKVAMFCPAYYRIALSATPLDRTDGANLRILAASGDVLADVPNKLLVDRGITAKADIIWDTIAEPKLEKKQRYVNVYKQGITDNHFLTERIVEWVKAFRDNNLSVLVMVESIEQGKDIDKALWTQTGGSFIPHSFVHGSESSEARDTALRAFSDRSLPVLVVSKIADEGLDVYSIDACIMAGSRKSKIKTLQRLGRGLRGERLIVVEFANYCHPYLIKHSLERLADYKAEEVFPIKAFKSSYNKEEFIKKLWDDQDKVNKERLK